jgi:hypothetical protein
MVWQDPPLDPYDPTSQDYTPETRPFDQVISDAIEAAFIRKHVWMPAQVINVKGNQKVDLQVLLMGRYTDGQVVTRAPIQNCMVSMPMGATYSIKVPVAVGDTGIAIFCDRSLDSWSVNGGIVDPQDSRTHDFSDAVFIPGLYPFAQQTTDATTDLVITNALMKVRIQKAGTILATNGTNELMDLLTRITAQVQSLSQTLSTDTVNTIFGPQKLNAFATYANIAITLEQLLVKLNTLKGS